MPRPSRIKPAMVDRIANFIANGGSKAEAGKTFGVSREYIYRLLNAREKELTGEKGIPAIPGISIVPLRERNFTASQWPPGKIASNCIFCRLKYYVPEAEYQRYASICSRECFDALEKAFEADKLKTEDANFAPFFEDQEDYNKHIAQLLNRVENRGFTFAFKTVETDIISETPDKSENMDDLFE